MVKSLEVNKEIGLILIVVVVVAVAVVEVLLAGIAGTSGHCCRSKNGFLNCVLVLIGTFEVLKEECMLSPKEGG